jgi:hypothetical protein
MMKEDENDSERSVCRERGLNVKSFYELLAAGGRGGSVLDCEKKKRPKLQLSSLHHCMIAGRLPGCCKAVIGHSWAEKSTRLEDCSKTTR